MSLPIATDENDSRLLESRRPRKTLTLDERDGLSYSSWSNLQCPLRNGIIYYSQSGGRVFEHDLYSSSNDEPRMITRLQSTSYGNSFSLIPINRNQILLIGTCHEESYDNDDTWDYLHVSVHEIHSYCVGPALWTYHNYGRSNIFQLQPMKSTTNALGITFGVDFKSHMKLFAVSTDTKDRYPLVEAGQLNYSRQLNDAVVLSPDRRILLNADRDNETIDVFYSGTGDTDNMDFSFVTYVSIPNPKGTNRKGERLLGAPLLAFSADGTKFAAGTADGVVSVWDVRSKVPLKVFEVDVPRNIHKWPIWHLQFSSGILGREVLVFMEDEVSTDLKIIHLVDATSFETEETLCLPTTNNIYGGNRGTNTLFFEPSGGSMYASLEGTLYEWNLRKNTSPEWWLGET
ncbi:hypothetical protein K443DRAFT_683104 [Laccaria amethystina LaAM-08-1]|uniref:DUF2415 domain-containing protein n=1 Tax=Laccaria amethystina LaAM-08-1 TaxID=1095629 RepID=A0A0C9WTL4_9AGAR|nr:hypothetical protein K443DRAFT_683104 [Laccaria amethystina LaAM-08-1]